jgi:hypothetical protein
MLREEWSQQGLNAMGKLVADIVVETLQNAGGKHRYCVVDEPAIGMARYAARAILRGCGGDVWEMVRENSLWSRRRLPQ